MNENRWCQFPTCENPSDGSTVVVSLDTETVELRDTCHACSEVFTAGVQHGRFRAIRLLLQKAHELSRSGAHTEAACYRLAAEAIDTVDDPADEVRPPRRRRWRWHRPQPK
jgi:hypothetical protein